MTDQPHFQFKLTYEQAGEHVHYKIWVRKPLTETWARSGTGCLNIGEWDSFKRMARDWCQDIQQEFTNISP